MIHTFTNHKFVLRFSRQMFLQVEYLFAVVLFSAAKTTEGAENGVFFQIKENNFFSYRDKSLFWSGETDSLLSCSVLCARLRAEVQTFWKTQDFVTFLAAKCKQVQQLSGY